MALSRKHELNLIQPKDLHQKSRIDWINDCRFDMDDDTSGINVPSINTRLTKNKGTVEIISIEPDHYLCNVSFSNLGEEFIIMDTVYFQK